MVDTLRFHDKRRHTGTDGEMETAEFDRFADEYHTMQRPRYLIAEILTAGDAPVRTSARQVAHE
jgi:hypothetical protein